MNIEPLHQCDCGEPMVEAASGDNLVANYACPKCSRRPTREVVVKDLMRKTLVEGKTLAELVKEKE